MNDNDVRVDDAQNTSAALRAGIAMGKPRELHGHKPYALVPEGAKVELLTPEDDRPARMKGHPKFDESASLVAYFNRFSDPASTLFADIDRSQVVAVIDHHQEPKQGSEVDSVGPRYHDHLATFVAKHSPEWLIWTANSGKAMKQEQFAIFIEDNAPDIKVPSPVDLYQMALNLEAAGSSEFKSHKRMEDGSVNFAFRDEVNGTSNGVPFPKELTVLLRPYVGCAAVTMTAKLRFRNEGGRLSLWYDLIRADHVKRAAFDEIVEGIVEGTAHEVLKGRPN